ncbi:MAG: bifunctional oligoribonuclease/PAP phosphatase NrnA [Phycisphaerae bacterium]
MKPFEDIVERLGRAKSILAVTHARPDGDGLGSIAALARAARAAGKRAAVLVPDKVPQRYAFLFGDDAPAPVGRFTALADEADAVVIVDTCSLSQLDDIAPHLEAFRAKTAVIDHHATRDDIGAARWTDTSAAAAGVMVLELLRTLKWPLDAACVEALATAVTTDTGWLRFSNTDSRCLRAMADLVDAGLTPDKLYARIFQTDRPERIRLMQRMLASLELHRGGRLAVMAIRRADFAASGAFQDETENLVNEALRIGSVEASVLLVETDGPLRASLRSRETIDVAAVAAQFGGGGHARAAGVRVSEGLDAFKVRLIAAFEREFAKAR